MAKGKQSTIIYDKHVEICSEYLSDEQFGKLMFTLTMGRDQDFGDDKLLSMAYAFISLQKKLDDDKYRQICERNRKNGAKGGRPRINPEKANGFSENPNDNDKTMKRQDNENVYVNESQHTSVLYYGRFENVELTGKEYYTLKQEYERTTDLINKVSVWLRTHDHPDHFALCITFAENDNWPRRKVIEPAELPEVSDPLPDEEHDAKVAELKKTLNGMFKA